MAIPLPNQEGNQFRLQATLRLVTLDGNGPAWEKPIGLIRRSDNEGWFDADNQRFRYFGGWTIDGQEIDGSQVSQNEAY